MNTSEVVVQLEDLINDRKSFLSDDKESNEIYLKDIQALQIAIYYINLLSYNHEIKVEYINN